MNKKIAIITGGSKGIGKAIVERLTADDFFTVVADVDEVNGELLAAKIGKEDSLFHYCDISNENSVRSLFEEVKSKYNRIDALVNNAGIIRDNMIWNMPVADFDKVMNVNLRGAWLMCREAAVIMKAQKSGRIVNISSRAWLGNSGQSNYSASKAGIIGMTRVLALELGRYNVLVNTVAPGLIDTPLTRQLEEEVLKRLVDAQPTKSMGRPEDVANAVSFLLSEKTNFITGQTVYVDGGKSIGAGV